MAGMLRTTVALAAVAAMLVAAGSAAAGTRPPTGQLTSTEYAQISASTKGVAKAVHNGRVNWDRAQTACRRSGNATPLLRSERVDCLAALRILQALSAVPGEESACQSSTSTTTQTTTTSAGAASLAALACMNPDYQALAHDASAMYSADRFARRQALDRGFGGVCLATLASTPKQLGQEHRFVSATTRLAADVALATKVALGQAPSSSIKVSKVDADASSFERAWRALLAQSGASDLAACPHL